MWHASVSPLRGRHLQARELRRIALKHLAAVGDREQEWEELGQIAYHVRRRLTPQEQALVGAAIDCRGGPEGPARLEAMRRDLVELPAPLLALAMREIGQHLRPKE